MKNKYFTIILFTLFSNVVFSQVKTNEKIVQKRTKTGPYELLKGHYNNNFTPFKKGNIYSGVALSLEDRIMENTENIF